MFVHDLKWSAREKKIARGAFEEALESAMGGIVSDFKAKAAAVTSPSEMWVLEAYLRGRRREIEDLFDYRYSQLPFVFARLVHGGYLAPARLDGLSEEKMELIRELLARERTRG